MEATALQQWHRGVQALEIKAARQEWQWVAEQVRVLVKACPRKAATEQQKRTRALLLRLQLLCRVELGNVKQLEPAEQKHLFTAWPYSVAAWSLFSRCAAEIWQGLWPASELGWRAFHIGSCAGGHTGRAVCKLS